MERIHGTRKASNFAPENVISRMPDNVITNIMNRLPIQDAVRTGILSRDWRFKWTMLTQIVFDQKFFMYLSNTEAEEHHEKIISRLLLHVKGPITKFVLNRCYPILDAEAINNWVMFLARKGIKELTILNRHAISLELHTHLFSCLQLKHLVLKKVSCHLMPGFCGFPDLLSLDLDEVSVLLQGYKYGEFWTQSPLLEILKLNFDTTCTMKLVEIAKLENLKVLSLPLCKVDDMKMITSSSFFQLICSFPKLQELTLNFFSGKVSADATKRVPTTLPCLRTVELHQIEFSSDNMVSCVFELIRDSPNLQALKIIAARDGEVPTYAIYSSAVDFSSMGQLQLQEVVLECSGGSENEVHLMKCLLACSPLLQKIVLRAKPSKMYGGIHGGMMFATKLLKFRRASPIAEVEIDWLS